MKSVLVSVISGQTIPNLLLIKEFAGKYDELLFITSFEMEGRGNSANSRSRWIERGCNIIEGTTRRIEVAEDSWAEISEKLQSLNDDADVHYIVNLTGGTKIMTLAIFEYFARPENTIYYIPFPKNEYHELFPNRNSTINKLIYRCNLNEYLLAHGLYYTRNDLLIAHQDETFLFFERVNNFDFKLTDVPEIIYAHDMLIPERKAYFSGVWFEEYNYHLIKKMLKLKQKEIAMNVKLFRDPDDTESDNEYDLMFVKENTLYVVECKVSLGKNLKSNLDRYLHKLGAITKDFGLKVNTYIFTLSNLGENFSESKKNIEKRRLILGIKAIIDQRYFNQIYQIEELFNQK